MVVEEPQFWIGHTWVLILALPLTSTVASDKKEISQNLCPLIWVMQVTKVPLEEGLRQRPGGKCSLQK